MNPLTLSRISLVLLASAPLILVNCSKSDEQASNLKTLETERAQAHVNNYEKNSGKEEKAKVELAFAALDSEIRELEVRIAKTEGETRVKAEMRLEEARKRRSELQAEFNQAKFDALIQDVKDAFR